MCVKHFSDKYKFTSYMVMFIVYLVCVVYLDFWSFILPQNVILLIILISSEFYVFCKKTIYFIICRLCVVQSWLCVFLQLGVLISLFPSKDIGGCNNLLVV